MVTAKANNPAERAVLPIVFGVLLGCFGLFWLDNETESISDLWDVSNIVALFIYFTATFFICYFFNWLFLKKYESRKSLLLSLFIGVPVGFTLVILCFLLLARD